MFIYAYMASNLRAGVCCNGADDAWIIWIGVRDPDKQHAMLVDIPLTFTGTRAEARAFARAIVYQTH